MCEGEATRLCVFVEGEAIHDCVCVCVCVCVWIEGGYTTMCVCGGTVSVGLYRKLLLGAQS